MTYKVESLINQPIIVPFVSINKATGMSVFTGVHFLKDGVSLSVSTTYIEIGHGLYTATFTPASTGLYTVFVEGDVQAEVQVVNKLTYTFLQNIEDEAIGSWVWNKNNGTLTIIRQDGSTLATFNVVDTLETASRERT